MKIRCLLCLSFAFASLVNIQACGINWAIPAGPYPNVSEQGVVSIWETIGQVPTSNKNLTLPIYLNFRADQNTDSSVLGVKGFTLSLADANAVAISENDFLIYTPSGRYKIFNRDKKLPNILHSSGNWKGEISGDTLAIYSDCGDRIKYVKGLISELQIKNQRFNYVRDERGGAEIREAGKTLVTFSRNSREGKFEIRFPTQKSILIELGERPEVKNITNKNLIVAKIPTIKTIDITTASKLDFEFKVSDKVFPIIFYRGREITWDPVDGTIVSDGNWSYSINQKDSRFSHATISRQDAEGRSEFVSHDENLGVKVEITPDGIKRETSRFTTGVMRGSIRRIELSKNGKLISKSLFSYNEQGLRIRELFEKDGQKTDVRFERETLKDGATVTKAVGGDGKLLWEKTVKRDGGTRQIEHSQEIRKSDKIVEKDKDGRVLFTKDSRGFEYQYLYDDAGRLQAILHSGKLQRRYLYDTLTQKLKQEVRFVEGGKLVVGLREFSDDVLDSAGAKSKWIGANDMPKTLRDNLTKEASTFVKNLPPLNKLDESINSSVEITNGVK